MEDVRREDSDYYLDTETLAVVEVPLGLLKEAEGLLYEEDSEYEFGVVYDSAVRTEAELGPEHEGAIEMALEVLYMAPYLDEIVLVTGDGDFVPLVHQLVWMGKIVRVIGPGRLTAQELGLVAHSFISLDHIEGILISEDADVPVNEAEPSPN